MNFVDKEFLHKKINRKMAFISGFVVQKIFQKMHVVKRQPESQARWRFDSTELKNVTKVLYIFLQLSQ